ncbi:MAG: CDP-glucose 4,6-dehydratase [Brevinema sp.]
MNCYKNKKVLVTGHTGFKGTWLCRTLLQLGSEVYGIGLNEGENKLFALSETAKDMNSFIVDIRDRELLTKTIKDINPEVIFHLAAQPLVLESYKIPVETFESNVMGTIHVLEACRSITNLQAIILITTDKVYHNYEWNYPYRETDRLGGYDPYSASKAMCELAIDSYRHSFYQDLKVKIVSVRAGNVIGGGDFADNRIIPDIIRAIQAKKDVVLRHPNSIRPWQHVMDAIMAYLLVGKQMIGGQEISPSYNIAPIDNSDKHTVEYIVKLFIEIIKQGSYKIDSNANFAHEMSKLRLDPSLIIAELGWKPVFNTEEAIIQTAKEYKAYLGDPKILKKQIDSSIMNVLNLQPYISNLDDKSCILMPKNRNC